MYTMASPGCRLSEITLWTPGRGVLRLLLLLLKLLPSTTPGHKLFKPLLQHTAAQMGRLVRSYSSLLSPEGL